jgi:hypothetical protein
MTETDNTGAAASACYDDLLLPRRVCACAPVVYTEGTGRQLSPRRMPMSLVKTWYAPAAAAEKFGVSTAQILEWVAAGLVRAEQDGDKVSLVNIDDVRLEVEAMVNRSS